MRKNLIPALLAVLTAASCSHEEVPFSFAVLAEGAAEGEDLHVSVSILKGPWDGYSLASSVEAYDIASGTGTPAGTGLHSAGVPAASMASVSFPDGGHRDFTVPGLDAGTYRVTVTLARDGKASTGSVVVVVTAKEGPGQEPGPGGTKYVTGFTLPVDDTSLTLETVSGMDCVVLDLAQYNSSNPFTWRSDVNPADADDRRLSARSLDNAVVVAVVRDGSLLSLTPVAAGVAAVTVASLDGNADRTFGVKVTKEEQQPPVKPVTDFTVPEPDKETGRVPVEAGKTLSFTPALTPADANTPVFTASSSDVTVTQASVSGGTVSITGIAPGYATVTVSVENGPSHTVPVMVWKDVTVRIEWEELEATEAQLKSKTFPCRLRFSSDSGTAFPTPITWTVAMKGVVTVSGQDSRTVSDNTDVRFYGNRTASYDVTSKILIPAWSVYRTNDFGLSVTLSLQRNSGLDPQLWRLSYDEAYLTQEAKIRAYITGIQQ